MALSDLQIGRVTRFFQKWSGIKGKGFPVSLSSEIQPSLDIFSGVENRFLDSFYRYAAFQIVAAQGAAPSVLRLRNPSGSGVIAVVEFATASEGAADLMFLNIGLTSADLGTVLTPAKLDSRIASTTSSLVLSSGTAASLGTNINGKSNIANGAVDFVLDGNQELVLNPGVALQISSNSNNVAINAAFGWRERALEDSEKS